MLVERDGQRVAHVLDIATSVHNGDCSSLCAREGPQGLDDERRD